MTNTNKGLAKEKYKKNQTGISDNKLTDEATSAFGNYLNETKQESDDLESEKQSHESEFIHYLELKIKDEHNKAIDAVLLRGLTPELVKNETQKREFKERLMRYILIILSVQLGIFLLVVLAFAFAFCFKTSFTKDISIEQLKHIVEFLKYYISAVIVEFIAMLFFIVKFVFDKSIVGLIKQLFNNDNYTKLK